MSLTLTASDRSSLIRLASGLPVGSPERKAVLAGLVRLERGAPLPTTVSLQDLETRDDYTVVGGVDHNSYFHRLSEHPGSVFYLTNDGYLIVVLAKKKKALVDQKFKYTTVWEAMFNARTIKSFGACLKENALDTAMNHELTWKEIRVLP